MWQNYLKLVPSATMSDVVKIYLHVQRLFPSKSANKVPCYGKLRMANELKYSNIPQIKKNFAFFFTLILQISFSNLYSLLSRREEGGGYIGK